MRLTKRRLRGLIKGSIPLIDTGVRTNAKKQMEHTLKNAVAYLGDLPYDYNESDNEDLPFKVTDSDDDDDEADEEEAEESDEADAKELEDERNEHDEAGDDTSDKVLNQDHYWHRGFGSGKRFFLVFVFRDTS